MCISIAPSNAALPSPKYSKPTFRKSLFFANIFCCKPVLKHLWYFPDNLHLDLKNLLPQTILFLVNRGKKVFSNKSWFTVVGVYTYMPPIWNIFYCLRISWF